MKKILFYTDTPLYGGAENHMFNLAKFLDSKKYEVILACSHYEGLDPWVSEWLKEGFRAYTLHVSHKHDPRHFSQLKKLIKMEKPDLLHLHLWNPGACRYGFLAGKAMKLPIVVTEHDLFSLGRIKNYLKKQALELADHVITISKNNFESFIAAYPQMKEKTSMIHNGIDTTWFFSQYLSFSDSDREKVREEVFGVSPDDIVVLTIGTLHPRKGLKYLIKAAGMMEDPRVKFMIAGSGPQKRELSGMIRAHGLEGKVKLLGQKKNIVKLLKSAEVFVLSSVKEAFGLVLLEAMTAGLPIVATRSGGVPEIVLDGKTGLLVDAEDSEALKQAITRLSKDEDFRTELGTAGISRVNREFDVKKMAESTAKIYDDILVAQ